MSQTLVIDAGHGGYDNGASFENRVEKSDNLNLALAVGNALKQYGYNVIFTRDTDIYQSPFEKAQIANNNNADYMISIHRNSSPEVSQYSGVQTLIYNEGGTKEVMANNVNEALENIGFNNLGISIRPNLTVLKRTKMPAILIEAGFINNPIDNKLFDENFEKIAQAIAGAINETIAGTPMPLPSYAPAYRIQIGLFRNYGNAVQQLNRATEDGFSGLIVPSDDYFAVQLGSYQSIEQAAMAARNLRNLGYETLIVTVQ